MELPDSVQVFSDKYLENISDAFKTLYNEEQLSDVTIYCKEGSLKAHKLILAASSPYFCKIFRENRNEFPILILQGTSLNQMKNLIDLLYNGKTDVKNDDVEALNALVLEFEIKGINFGPKSSSSNVRLEMNSNTVSPDSVHNRDTRFKGKKRVAVDYERDENPRTNLPSTSRLENDEMFLPKRALVENVHVDEPIYIKREISTTPTDGIVYSSSDITSVSDISSYMGHSENKLTAWAKKQRKFKCNLCPSSFKRSSHLSRHQLVHTGERPYSCPKCDKAFSRHDKLKHHIRKAHEFIPDSMYERIDDSSDTESNVRNYTSPHPNESEEGPTDLSTPKSLQGNTSPLFTISHISSILEDSFVNPPKKGRGRPRKYPIPAASPAVLYSNQELPVSNDIEATEKVDDLVTVENKGKVKKRKRRSWMDSFISENGGKRTSTRLRQQKNINNNEDFMFFQMDQQMNVGPICEICDKPFVYQARLNTHMKKIHGITNDPLEIQSDSCKFQTENVRDIIFPKANKNIVISSACSSLENKFGEKLQKERELKGITANSDKTEKGTNSTKNLSYEQLRELLPKECTIRPIVGGVGEIVNPNTSNALAEGPPVIITRSSLEDITYLTIGKKDDTTRVLKKTRKPKKSRMRKKKERGIIRYARARRPKPKSDQPVTKQLELKVVESTPSDNSINHSSVSHIEENSATLHIGSETTPLKIPQLSSAIEISIVSPKKKNSPANIIYQKRKVGEDLSITAVGTLENDPRQEMTDTDCNLNSYSNNIFELNNLQIEEDSSSNSSQLFQLSDMKSEFLQKRIRGRPKTNNGVPSTLKRGRGRPARYQVYSSRPGVQNYNITNLPYGDLNYLTSQTNTEDDEEPLVIMEPLVEINMDQNEQSRDAEASQNEDEVAEKENSIGTSSIRELDIRPVVQISEEVIKEEENNDVNGLGNIDISEIENKIGLIGECTISVAN